MQLTACRAANLSFVMLLFDAVSQAVLRQSLDVQEITFSNRAILHKTFLPPRVRKKNFPIPKFHQITRFSQ